MYSSFVLNSISDKLYSVISNIKIKLTLVLPLLFADIQFILFVFLSLVLIDTLLGTLYAVKSGTFRSSRFSQSLFKMLLYMILIISSRLIELLVSSFIETTVLTEVIIILIAVTEFSSILENSIALGVPLPKSNVLTKVLKRFNIEEYTEHITNKEINERLQKDFNILLKVYSKLITDKQEKVLYNQYLLHWEQVIFKDLQQINFNTNIEHIINEISLLRKRNLTHFIKRVYDVNKIPKRKAVEFNKKHLQNLKKIESEIYTVLESTKTGETKEILIKKIYVQFLYSCINDAIE